MKNPDLKTSQLKAIELMASGKSITDVAKELNVDNSTIHIWLKKPTFKAYYNQIVFEVKQLSKDNILNLHNKALNTLNDCLNSENEAIKLKTALYIIDKVENLQHGDTDPIEIIKNECKGFEFEIEFNQAKFKKLCKENDIEIQ